MSKYLNKKISTSITITIIVLFVVLTGGFFAYYQYYIVPKEKIKIPEIKLPEIPKIETLKPVDWESLIPIIRTVIGPTFLDVQVEKHLMSIWETSDITGDGIPEALIYLGQGGAYTSFLTLMKIENDKPVVAQFKQEDGKISSLMFLSGASVGNGVSVAMLPEKNTIFAGYWSRVIVGESYGGLTNCEVEVYQWNPLAKTFDFNRTLSNEIRPEYCQKADI